MIQNELIYFYRLPACHAGCPCSADIIKDARKRPWEEVVTTTPPLKSENRVSTSFIEAQVCLVHYVLYNKGKITKKQRIMKTRIRAPACTAWRRRQRKKRNAENDDRRRNGEDIILDFPFLVPGSCLFHASLCSSFLTAISRWDRKSITTSSFLRVLRLLRMYVSPVVRSLMSSSPILHTIVHNYSHSNP